MYMYIRTLIHVSTTASKDKEYKVYVLVTSPLGPLSPFVPFVPGIPLTNKERGGGGHHKPQLYTTTVHVDTIIHTQQLHCV